MKKYKYTVYYLNDIQETFYCNGFDAIDIQLPTFTFSK